MNSTLLNAINEHRSRNGCNLLVRNAVMTRIAQEYAERLAETESLAHSILTYSAAENIAWHAGNPNCDRVMRIWTHSRVHNNTILADFDYTGLGVARSKRKNTYYVQHFSNYPPREYIPDLHELRMRFFVKENYSYGHTHR